MYFPVRQRQIFGPLQTKGSYSALNSVGDFSSHGTCSFAECEGESVGDYQVVLYRCARPVLRYPPVESLYQERESQTRCSAEDHGQ